MKNCNVLKSLLLVAILFTASILSAVNKYVKVTEDLTDWTGTYLIVCEEQSVAFNGSLTDLDVSKNNISVEIGNNNEIVGNANLDTSVFKIAKLGNGYSLKSYSGSYITSNLSGKKMFISSTVDTTLKLNVSLNATNGVLIESTTKTKGYLKYNIDPNTGLRFRFYDDPAGQKPIQLYKLDNTAVSVATPQLSVAAGDFFAPFDLELTCATADANIFYAIDNGIKTQYTGKIHIDKTVTLKVWAEKGTEKSRVVTAKYTYHESNKVANIREFKEKAFQMQDQTFVLTGEVQVLLIHEKTNRIFLFDNTGDIKVYNEKLAKQLKVGDKLKNISCKYDKYDKKMQMGVIDIPIIEHAQLAPENKKLYDLALSDTNKLVQLRDVQIFVNDENEKVNSVYFTEDPKGTPVDLMVTDGTEYINVRSHYCNFAGEYVTGDRVEIIGLVSSKNDTLRVHITSIDRVKPDDFNAANLREFISKAKADTTAEFTITGTVTVTYIDQVNGEVYFQDKTAAISSKNAIYLSNVQIGKQLTNMKAMITNNKGRLQLSIVSAGDEIQGEAIPDIYTIDQINISSIDRYIALKNVIIQNDILFDNTVRYVEVSDGAENYLIIKSSFGTFERKFEKNEIVDVVGIVTNDFGNLKLNIVQIGTELAIPTPEETKLENTEFNANVYTNNGTIFVETEVGAVVELYTIDGRNIESLVAETTLIPIKVNTDMVIVRVDGECHKVMVK